MSGRHQILIVILWLMNAAIANAAAMKEDALGCKDIANAKKTLDAAKENSKSSHDVTRAKIAEGTCRWLRKNDVVEIDAHEGRFVCVRPPGDIECSWASQASVNEHPGYTPAPFDATLPPSPMPMFHHPVLGPILR